MRKQVPSSAIGKDFRLANVVPGVGKHGVRRRQGICGVKWGICGFFGAFVASIWEVDEGGEFGG